MLFVFLTHDALRHWIRVDQSFHKRGWTPISSGIYRGEEQTAERWRTDGTQQEEEPTEDRASLDNWTNFLIIQNWLQSTLPVCRRSCWTACCCVRWWLGQHVSACRRITPYGLRSRAAASAWLSTLQSAADTVTPRWRLLHTFHGDWGQWLRSFLCFLSMHVNIIV